MVVAFVFAVASFTSAQTTWTKSSANPVVQVAGSNTNDANRLSFGYAPSVLYDATANLYKMWFVSVTSGDPLNNVSYATSPDGVNWSLYAKNPVLLHGNAGSFDYNVWDPFVVYDGTEYKMYYAGMLQNASTTYGLGLATSPDGITWTKYGNNPVLAAGTGWDQAIGCGGVYFDGTIYHMWYHGAAPGQPTVIGYATSSDGINWTKYAGNPVLTSSPSGWDSKNNYLCDVIQKDGTYYMFYLGDSASGPNSIGLATSSDGIQWTKYTGNPVLQCGSAGGWDGSQLGQCSILYDNNEFKMWYSGYNSNGNHWQTGYAESPVSQLVTPNSFTETISVTDPGTSHQTLTFGAVGGATAGIDTTFGEYELPPVPPSGDFDARWLMTGTNGSLTDIQDTLGTGNPEDYYTGAVQPGAAGYPITLHWNPNSLPQGSFYLEDANTQGSAYRVSMKAASSFAITGTTPQPFAITYSDTPSVQSSTFVGWNMVSVPVFVQNSSISSLFPTSDGHAFSYAPNGGYQTLDTLSYGFGYWIKYDSSQAISVSGFPRTSDTLQLSPGWQLIGSLSSNISTSSIVQNPSNLIISQIYGYTGSGYVSVSQIVPLGAYWVKAETTGVLIRSTGSNATVKTSAKSDKSLEQLNTLKISDSKGRSQTLYFGADLPASQNFHLEYYALPPLPPAGSFDVRFDAGQQVVLFTSGANGTSAHSISIQGASYPVTISWEFNGSQESIGSSKDFFAMLNPVTGQEIASGMGIKGSIKLTDAKATQVNLMLRSSSRESVPLHYELSQNYPNPFNPSTTINYALPHDSYVTLRIYNPLGQVVATLINGEQPQGRHSIVWEAANMPSGIYICRIGANGFTQAIKMLLIR